MIRFARLFESWDRSNSTLRRTAALKDYFEGLDARDAAWATFFLLGQRPKGVLKRASLLAFGIEESGLPAWLFEESNQMVGDMAETITLLLDQKPSREEALSLNDTIERFVLPLQANADPLALLREGFYSVPKVARLPFLKLITGSFRVGVSKGLVVKALSDLTGLAKTEIAARLAGQFQPTPEAWERLVAPTGGEKDASQPFPFFLASQLEGGPSSLGQPEDWFLEWKWDGIRGQLVKRAGEVHLWSRGEELVTSQFPEVEVAGKIFPDGTVIDGEILSLENGIPRPFNHLQERLGRRSPGKDMLAKVPVVMIAYDLLEIGGKDIRDQPLSKRRAWLEDLVRDRPQTAIHLSPIVQPKDWEEAARLREESRDRRVEGFLLKRKSSPYQTGRKRGDWWKWKVDPFSFDAVLLYAQAGRGKRASLYTDLTFGVWDEEGKLVPVAKAYSGLTNEELGTLDHWIKRNVKEKFGPVRSVEPAQVFELAFEGIQESKRHRSGIAMRFPRILRWRKDKKPAEADTLASLRKLLAEGKLKSEAA